MLLFPLASKPDARDCMLLTDKELKRMTRFERRELRACDVKLAKVQVYNTDVFYCFGRRFALAIKEYIAEK